MKNIYSNIYSYNSKTLKKTTKSLKQGGIVGLPTETVYGLAGNAYSKKAVNKIFKLKRRPKINPLIVHYSNFKQAMNDVEFNKNFYKLYNKFCPGPITFILNKKRRSKIDSMVTAKLNTVAVRFPNHRVMKKILKILEFPLAMPSANFSSGVSPVSAYHVFEEFKKKLKIIVDGGDSKIGLESTVIDLTGVPKILRPGIINTNEIKNCLKVKLSMKGSKIKSPGMMKRHYSPGIPVILNKKPSNQRHAYIVFGKKYKNSKNNFNLSKKGSLKEAAANLYKIMRKIKKKGYKKIFIAKIPNRGPGLAIKDRLRRASK